MSLSVLHICPCALLVLSCVVNAFPAQHEVHGEADCTPIAGSTCAARFYSGWHARFPNARGLNLVESLNEFTHFRAFLDMNNYCSNRLYILLCWHYFPQCRVDRPDFPAVVPCREICLQASEACQPYANDADVDLSKLQHLNCSNFPSIQEDTSGDSESGSTESSKKYACPPPNIHLDFSSNNKILYVSEGDDNLEFCLKISSAGSFESLAENVTVQLSITDTKFSFLTPAIPQLDYQFASTSLFFPEGSAKESQQCVNLEIVDDYVKENRKTFTVVASIISPNNAYIGGAKDSSSSSIEIVINDNEIAISEGECKSSRCNVRTAVNRKTFAKQPCYDYAAKVQLLRIEAEDEPYLIVNITQCWERESGACPNDTNDKCIVRQIPFCSNCQSQIGSLQEKYFVIAGKKNSDGELTLPNYKSGGIFGVWKNKYLSFVRDIYTC